MARASFTLHGDDELMRALNKAYRQAPKSAQKVLQNSSEYGKKQGQKYAPKDTWFMHDHIKAKHKGMFESQIESEAGYSGFVNYGTRFMSAQPFFDSMWRDTLAKFQKDMQEVARGLLR